MIINSLVGAFLIFEVFDTNNQDYRVWIGEIFAGFNYAVLTVALIVHQYIQYKREICWTFVTPIAFAIFCYCTMSLLIFPTSAFFYINKFKLFFAIVNILHLLLLSIVCLAMYFTIRRGKETPNQTLDFELD
jgi:hypothetical protein